MSNHTCDSCRFWELDVVEYESIRSDYPAHPPDGECFRYPPVHECQTRTNAYCWCGEYKERTEEENNG